MVQFNYILILLDVIYYIHILSYHDSPLVRLIIFFRFLVVFCCY